MDKVSQLVSEALEGGISRREFVRKAFLLGASAPLLGLGLAACTDDNAVPGITTSTVVGGNNGNLLLGFSVISFEFGRIPFDVQFLEERATELGIDVITQGAENDSVQQDTQIEAMLAQGIDALIIFPVDVQAARATVSRVKAEAGIPIISYNNIIQSPDIDYWVARDNFLVGEQQVNHALSFASEGNYVIISGEAGSDIAEEKTEGAVRALQQKVDAGEVQIVSQEFHDAWSPQSALAQMENALTQTSNDIQAVIANEDGMMLGALQALEEQNLAGEVFLCGEDIFPDTARAIVDGTVHCSSWTDLIAMSATAVEAAQALANSQSPPGDDTVDIEGQSIPGQRIGSDLVTRDNLSEFLERTGWLSPEDAGL